MRRKDSSRSDLGVWSCAMELFDRLKANPLLTGFTDDGVKIIQVATSLREMPAGTPIFVEKMHGESAFLLSEGAVVLTRGGGPSERQVGLLHPPDSFGELALLQPGPRRVSARAQTDVILLEITRRDFHNLMKQRPQACAKFMMNIAASVAGRVADAAPVLERILDA